MQVMSLSSSSFELWLQLNELKLELALAWLRLSYGGCSMSILIPPCNVALPPCSATALPPYAATPRNRSGSCFHGVRIWHPLLGPSPVWAGAWYLGGSRLPLIGLLNCLWTPLKMTHRILLWAPTLVANSVTYSTLHFWKVVSKFKICMVAAPIIIVQFVNSWQK
jgi:hypothetical protein